MLELRRSWGFFWDTKNPPLLDCALKPSTFCTNLIFFFLDMTFWAKLLRPSPDSIVKTFAGSYFRRVLRSWISRRVHIFWRIFDQLGKYAPITTYAATNFASPDVFHLYSKFRIFQPPSPRTFHYKIQPKYTAQLLIKHVPEQYGAN